MNRGRRRFIYQMLLFAGWLLKPRLAFPARPPTLPPTYKIIEELERSIEGFLDEKFNYDIAFLWFKKAASGSFKLTREGDGYMAILEAETKGFIGFLTSYRRHIYRSHMSYLPDEKKLRVHFFERHVTIGKKVEKTLTRLDNDKGIIQASFFEKGELVRVEDEPIPKGVEYEDILSAFYNARIGHYGPLEAGRHFQIRTIPSEGESVIDVEILSRDEALQWRRDLMEGSEEKFIAAKIRLPRKLFESKKGEVSALFNEALIPVQGVVKNYIGFGDMKCSLITKETLSKDT